MLTIANETKSDDRHKRRSKDTTGVYLFGKKGVATTREPNNSDRGSY